MSEPLVPAHVDLRDFPFMPLDVARLRDSAIVDSISGEEFRAAILLWCASWHQVPAGSLPDDPRQLSKFAGYGRVVSEWEKVAEGALYGWVKCSDGRWYHPVIAEKAIEAWEKKAEFSERSASRAERAKAAAEARWGKKDPSPSEGEGGGNGGGDASDAVGNARAHAEQCRGMPDALLKGNRQGQGQVRDLETQRGAAREPERRGADELGGLLRPFVGSLPVSVDPDLSPILALLRDGLTEADVIAGVQACVERARRKPRCWGDFENWIRRAAKDRLEVAPRSPLPAAIRAPDPEKIRRGLFILACEHFRGRWSDGWSNATRPGHPDCTTPEEIIEEARLAVELERSVDLSRLERRPAFAH